MSRKGKCLEKVLSGLLLCSPLLFSSCATTHSTYNKVSRREAKPMVIVDTSSIEATVNQPKKDIDSIISANTEFSDYLTFRNKYEAYSRQIKSRIENGDFSEADQLVKDLGRRLRSDPSQYAKQYLSRVQNFSYIIFEVNDKISKQTSYAVSGGRQNSRSKNTIGLIFQTPFVLAIDTITLPFTLLSGGEGMSAHVNGHSYDPKTDNPNFWLTRTLWADNVEKVNKEKTLEKTYDKILVTPYTGTKRKIGENIPYSRLRGELR